MDIIVRGCFSALALMVVFLIVLSLSSCGTRNDGMDDLWIGVQHVERDK